MNEEPPAFIRKAFPFTWYHPGWKLLTWFPRGVLNEAFIQQVVDFVETEERIQEAPFDRYIDFSHLTDIRLNLDQVITTARRRRRIRQPVKSAIYANKPITFSIAQMYERLMYAAVIEVRAFEKSALAAAWLEVPPKELKCPL